MLQELLNTIITKLARSRRPAVRRVEPDVVNISRRLASY